MTTYTTGQYVSWDTASGTATVRITSVTADGVSYECADGFHEAADVTMYTSMERITRGWRPANPAEVTAFDARYRPGPQNWH